MAILKIKDGDEWEEIVSIKGEDGVSPTVETSKSGKTTTITITDAEGPHTATILDGNDGNSEWGNITGTLSNQTDLKNALDAKANSSDIPDVSSFITKNVNDLTYYTLKTNTGSLIDLEINQATYVVTLSLKDQDGNIISSDTIDLPLENVVVNGSYDSANQKIVLTLQNGNTVDIPVGALVAGLQTEITSSNKLSSDLVDDSNSGHKFVTSSDKTAWNAKYDKPSGGIPSTDLSSTVQTSLGKADSALQSITSSDVTTALGYTPYDSSNPSGYTSNTGTITDVQVNNISTVSSGVANLVTETAYNSSTNKIATMSDVPLDFYGQGTPIPENANLDTYLTEGKYYANSDATATSLTNCPATVNFVMYVMKRTTYITQIIIDRHGRIFTRPQNGSGLGSWTSPSNFFYGTCSTTNSTRDKVVACPEFELKEGSTVSVFFTNAQSYNGTPRLNVNGTGAITIQYKKGSDAVRYMWASGEVIDFTYDGSVWVMHKGGIATSTYYGITKLSSSLTSTNASIAANSYALNQLMGNIIFGTDVYSASKTYNVGDRVRYSYSTWECTTAITTAEEWDETHWTQLEPLQTQIEDLQTQIDEKVWVGTENQYDAIATKNPDTLYCITES